MVRLKFILILSSFGLAACQQTKMSTKPVTPRAVPQAAAIPGPAPQAPPPGQPPVYPPAPPPVDPRPPGIENPVITAPPSYTPPTPVTPQPLPPRPTGTELPAATIPPVSPPLTPTSQVTPVQPPVGVPPTFTPPSISNPVEIAPPPPTPPTPPIVPQSQPQSQPVPAGGPTLLQPQRPLPPARPNPGQVLSGGGAPPAPSLQPTQESVPRSTLPANPPNPPARPSKILDAPSCENGRLDCRPMVARPDQCGPVALKATENIKQAKLDVLFVVDTSASLRGGKVGGKRGELEQIASQMEAFVNNFPEETDINIGVLLGHGTGHWLGRLFRTSPTEALVLKTREIRNRQDLVRRLEAKMKNVPNEKGGAQGEALLYSLYNAVARPNLRAEMSSAGMLREDATLAVIMVSDEQDVCFDYSDKENFDPKTGQAYIPHGKKNAQGQPIPDPAEVAFFNNVCKKAVNKGTELLTPEITHKALQAVKNGNMQKIVLMGLVYDSNDITPAGVVQNAREDENEMGHGIIQFVGKEGGQIVGLGRVQEGPTKFREELKFLGDFTKKELTSNGNVSCDPGIHPASIDESSIQVELHDESGQLLRVFSRSNGGLRAVDTRPKGVKNQNRYLQAFVEPGVLNKELNDRKVKNPKVTFTYMTRNDRDPRTGAAVDPKTSQPIK